MNFKRAERKRAVYIEQTNIGGIPYVGNLHSYPALKLVQAAERRNGLREYFLEHLRRMSTPIA